jgi:tetratricopeptide (TPR) repeat protein
MCIEKGRYSEGLDALKRAVSYAPGTPEYKYNLAAGFYKSGKSDQAKKILKNTLVDNNPFPDRTHAEKLLAELEKGLFD